MLMNEFEKACETLRKFMAYMLEKDMKSWMELWDENAVFEFPYAPEGSPKRIEGKAFTTILRIILSRSIFLHLPLRQCTVQQTRIR